MDGRTDGHTKFPLLHRTSVPSGPLRNPKNRRNGIKEKNIERKRNRRKREKKKMRKKRKKKMVDFSSMMEKRVKKNGQKYGKTDGWIERRISRRTHGLIDKRSLTDAQPKIVMEYFYSNERIEKNHGINTSF